MSDKPLTEVIESQKQEEVMQIQMSRYRSILAQLNRKKRYQYILIVFVSLIWVMIAFSAMLPSFVFMNPLFECNGILTTETQACQDISQCHITNDFSAVEKTKLYCDNQMVRSTIQSIYAIGNILGMFIIPLLNDVIGRRKAAILNFVFAIPGLLMIYLGVNQISYPLIMIGTTMVGFSVGGYNLGGFIITCDFLEDRLREKALMIYCAMWGFGEMLFYPIYFYLPQWENFLIFVMILPTTILLMFSFIFLIESPVYAIFVKKDLQLFKSIVTKLSKFNQQHENQEQVINEAQQIIQKIKGTGQARASQQLSKSLGKIFGTKTILLTCICLIINAMSFNLFYYGSQGSMERTGFNFGMSMLLIGIHQFFAYLSASYLTKYIPRKIGMISAVLITGCLGILFIFKQVQQGQTVQSVLVSMTRVSSVYVYCFLILIETQLLDLDIRSTAIAFIEGFGHSSRILIPFIINFMNNKGLPTLIVTSAVFIFAGTLPILPLKQTFRKAESSDYHNQTDEIQAKQEHVKL